MHWSVITNPKFKGDKLNNTSYVETCEIFRYSERIIKRWIDRYDKKCSIKRQSRNSISYKITKDQFKYALNLLKKITMEELTKLNMKKYKDFLYYSSSIR